MELNRYIQHPEQLNRETLYDLRSYVALYPYHQAARLLMLQNLYLLHDPTFDEELRQAAFYITDRTVLFNLVESKYYTIAKKEKTASNINADRTASLIDDFLESQIEEPQEKQKRKPTPADATVDYIAYLLETEEGEEQVNVKKSTTEELIDNFLENEGGKLTLNVEGDYTPHNEVKLENDRDDLDEGYFTETLARIYIKQGKYLQALEIIQQLNLDNSKKNAYFADQMRFLEKIIAIKQLKN